MSKTKNLIFRKGGRIPRDLVFIYDGEPLEIVKAFKYFRYCDYCGGGVHHQKHKTH